MKCKHCNNKVKAKELCSSHYMRYRRHGDPLSGRPIRENPILNHPLHGHYLSAKRTGIVDEWMLFESFINDIGNKPHKNAQLHRYDTSLPLGPDNFFWKYCEFSDLPTLERKRKQLQRFYVKNPDKSKEYTLKYKYNLTQEQYDQMLEKQHGVCKICKQPETTVARGKQLTLAVDHCHATGAVRGLLCVGCNTGLGHFKDDPSLLTAAIDYINQSC